MKIFFAIIAAAALSFATAFDSAVSKTGELEAHVTIKGLNHDDPSEDYIKVLNDAFVEAFNTVHPKKGYHINNINVEKEIDVPEDNEPMVTHFKDGVALGASSKRRRRRSHFYSHFFQLIGFGCDLCPNDDDAFGDSAITTLLLADHSAIQKEFFEKIAEILRNSGLQTYEDIESVEVYYLHKPKAVAAATRATKE